MARDKNEEQSRKAVRRPQATGKIGADWEAIDAGALRHSVATAGLRGGALRFGYTRDGGAYAIGVYGLGEPYTAYLRPGDDVEGFLAELDQAYADLS